MLMEIPFTKLHGNGNDFILIDEIAANIIPDDLKGRFAELYCHRRYGIGADGVLFLSKSDETQNPVMRLFQPDQSEAEMCGNGLRCLAKYLFDAGYVKESCTVETLAGNIKVTMEYREEEFYATIEMPPALFERNEIPATGEGEYLENIAGYQVFALRMGVPHAVVFVDEIGKVAVGEAAPPIRNHPSFLEGANVNFVEIAGENELHIRTYERGVEAETLSCGTGATAAAALARHLEKTGDEVQVITTGGALKVFVKDPIMMEGPATTVYAGVIFY